MLQQKLFFVGNQSIHPSKFKWSMSNMISNGNEKATGKKTIYGEVSRLGGRLDESLHASTSHIKIMANYLKRCIAVLPVQHNENKTSLTGEMCVRERGSIRSSRERMTTIEDNFDMCCIMDRRINERTRANPNLML